MAHALLAITFDSTISLGNVLTIIGLIGGLFGIYVRLAERLVALETKVDALWDRRGRTRNE